MQAVSQKALVVLSGGQDSTTCLYWAMDKFGSENVSTVSFDYGQRHRTELESAQQIAQLAGVEHEILPINTFNALGGNALTGDKSVSNELDMENNLPNTFVPGRNIIFMSYAAALAYQKKITHLVTGVAQTDYSGYPDCRQDTLDALQKTLNLGMEQEFIIHTPLMYMSKAETVKLAVKLDALDALALSHTCYNGLRPPCGQCAACALRAKGFAEAGIEDPLISASKKSRE